MEKVLQCNDTLEIILYKLPFYIVSSLLGVNKQFYNIGKVIYDDKMNHIHNYSHNVMEYIDECLERRHLLNFEDKILMYEKYCLFLKDLSINNYWPILIHQPEFCERFFITSCNFKYNFIYHTTLLHPLHFQNKDWITLLKPIQKYLFIQNPVEYNINRLRIFATLKGIQGNYKLNKSQLIQKLKFKSNKSYKLNI